MIKPHFRPIIRPLIRPPVQPLLENLLVMVNGTEASINAVKYAIIMAKSYRCRVYAVYVVDTATIKQLMLNRIFIEEESREYEKSLEENGKRYLAYVEKLAADKGVKVETELRKGAIWSEVIVSAEEKHVNIILTGEASAGEHRETMSSTVKSVLLNARCSVLVVKERMIDQLYKLI